MRFRLIRSGKNTPFMNMAIDEALLSSEHPVLRFYQWNPAGLSIGYAQHIKAINTNFCRKNHIKIVRRITGGNAVLHDNELTYSFIVDESYMPKSIVESYKKISQAILKALHLLGLKAAMNKDVKKEKKEEKSAVCFNDPNWYEIMVNGKKIVGSAQTRKNKKLLQHGAVLIGIDVEKYARCFANYDENLLVGLNKRVSSINYELGSVVSYDVVARAVQKGFEDALGINFEEAGLTEKEKAIAERLEKEKYSAREWNFLR